MTLRLTVDDLALVAYCTVLWNVAWRLPRGAEVSCCSNRAMTSLNVTFETGLWWIAIKRSLDLLANLSVSAGCFVARINLTYRWSSKLPKNHRIFQRVIFSSEVSVSEFRRIELYHTQDWKKSYSIAGRLRQNPASVLWSRTNTKLSPKAGHYKFVGLQLDFLIT